MVLLSPTWLGIAFGVSELLLSIRRRAGSDTAKDSGSLALFWTLIPIAMILAYGIAYSTRLGALPWPAVRWVGEILVIGGLLLRWHAILYLGRWFTVNVAIAADQPLVQDGPYRHVRHPSYTGALLALVGIGLALGNALSLIAIVLLTVPAFLRRIQVEERVLSDAFGATWAAYRARSWRLVPGLY